MAHPLAVDSIASQAPCKDVTGMVSKTEQHYFAYGGFSEVYQCVFTEESGKQMDVAVKVLRGMHLSREAENFKRRLNRETWVWCKLKHDNILPFIGITNDFGPFPALVSLLCKEKSALEYLLNHPDASRPKFVLGIAKGIEYLHQNEVIHGDIKGSNVLVDHDGNPLLCDFGRSKFIDIRGFTTAHMAGAVRYMAPELLLGSSGLSETDFEPILTKETDIYGFSMLGVEVLTEKMPFASSLKDWAIILNVGKGVRPEKTELVKPGEREAVWSLLEKCWQHQPEKRLKINDVVKSIEEIITEYAKSIGETVLN